MKQKGSLLILLIVAGLIYAATRKPKRKGTVEIGPLRSGFNPEDILSDEEKTMFEL
jgi:hypothetical protein